MSSGQRRWVLAAVLLLAFALRLYRLGAESLWYDETVSVHLAGKSLPALIAHTAGDIHPPGYYLLLHGWTRLAGNSEFAVAFPSLFGGLLLVAMAYRLAARTCGPAAALLAAFLVAISPYNLWYSQEVRMYTLGAALGMGLLLVLVSLLKASPGMRPAWWWLAVYALCGALGLWTLYYFAFLLLAVNLMVGGWWLAGRWQKRVGWGWLGLWMLAQGAVLLLYAPWLPVAWRQATSPPVPPWREFTPLGRLLAETWSALSLGQSVVPGKVWPVLALFAVLFVVGLLARPGRSMSWLLAGHLFLPVLLLYLASFITPLYHVRYIFTYSTTFYIIISTGLMELGRRWRPALWLSLTLIAACTGVSISNYHTDPHYAADDHRAAVCFLAEHWRPGDGVLINAGYAYTALLTYWDGDPIAWRGRLVEYGGQAPDDGPVVAQTGTVDGDPSLGWGDPASDFYAMSRAETAAALERLFARSDRVWVYRIYDTVTDPDGFIRNWLDRHGTKFEDQVFTGESQLRVQGYLTGRDPLTAAGSSCRASLADGSLHLLASHLRSTTVPVGGALDLTAVWQVSLPLQEEAILFAGLFDEEGQRWAQTDERPLGSLYPVMAWAAGSRVRTPLRLTVPPGTPPGRYRLEVGWYHFVEGQPFWLPWSGGDNRLLLGLVEVIAPVNWWALPPPPVTYPADVTLGSVRFLGFNAPSLTAGPGEEVHLDLFWQALRDGPEQGAAVLQLADEAGKVLVEASSPPVGGRVPFTLLGAGQVIRDPRLLTLPADLPPGIYTLSLGRRQPDGSWLTVRRGFLPLGMTYPVATIWVGDGGISESASQRVGESASR